MYLIHKIKFNDKIPSSNYLLYYLCIDIKGSTHIKSTTFGIFIKCTIMTYVRTTFIWIFQIVCIIILQECNIYVKTYPIHVSFKRGNINIIVICINNNRAAIYIMLFHAYLYCTIEEFNANWFLCQPLYCWYKRIKRSSKFYLCICKMLGKSIVYLSYKFAYNYAYVRA